MSLPSSQNIVLKKKKIKKICFAKQKMVSKDFMRLQILSYLTGQQKEFKKQEYLHTDTKLALKQKLKMLVTNTTYNLESQ